jgi:hypothetical protein
MSIYAVNGKVPVAAWIPSRDTAGNGTSTLTDLVGSNNGTLTNMDAATDWVADTGAGGVRALDFDGVNDEVRLTSVFSTMPFSVSIWFKADDNTVNRHLFSVGQTATIDPFFTVGLRGDLAGDPVQVQMRGNNNLLNTFATSNFVINQWMHVVAVFASTSSRSVFLDNALGVSDTTTHTVEPLNVMTIGCLRRVVSQLFFDGMIDDIRLFNTALNASDVAILYNAGNGRGRITNNSTLAMGMPL